jgi:hypothetical protein
MWFCVRDREREKKKRERERDRERVREYTQREMRQAKGDLQKRVGAHKRKEKGTQWRGREREIQKIASEREERNKARKEGEVKEKEVRGIARGEIEREKGQVGEKKRGEKETDRKGERERKIS